MKISPAPDTFLWIGLRCWPATAAHVMATMYAGSFVTMTSRHWCWYECRQSPSSCLLHAQSAKIITGIWPVYRDMYTGSFGGAMVHAG